MTVSKTTNTVFRGTSQANVGAVPSLQATITTTTNWSVPEGINSVYAVVIGAGSGGAWGARTNLDPYGGRGGAGGWVGGSQIPVTSGGSLSITIGAGGSGGTGTNQVVGSGGGITQVQSGAFKFYAAGAGTTVPSSGTTDVSSSTQSSNAGTTAVTTSAFVPNFSNINYVASIGRGSGALVGAWWETQVTSPNRLGVGEIATFSAGGGASRHRQGWGAPGPTAGGSGGGTGNNTSYGGFSPSYTGGISGNSGGGGGGAGYLGHGGAGTGGFGGSGGIGGGGGGGGAANADGTSRGGAGGQGAVLIYY